MAIKKITIIIICFRMFLYNIIINISIDFNINVCITIHPWSQVLPRFIIIHFIIKTDYSIKSVSLGRGS